MADVETRVNCWFLTRKIQLVEKSSLHVGYVKMERPRPPGPGDENTNLRDEITPKCVNKWFYIPRLRVLGRDGTM
jgi:hypothetical protein